MVFYCDPCDHCAPTPCPCQRKAEVVAGRDYRAEAEAAWPTMNIAANMREAFIRDYIYIATRIDIHSRKEAAQTFALRRLDALRNGPAAVARRAAA